MYLKFKFAYCGCGCVCQIMDAYLELLQMESKHIFFRLPSTIILKWSKRRFGDWLFTKVCVKVRCTHFTCFQCKMF